MELASLTALFTFAHLGVKGQRHSDDSGLQVEDSGGLGAILRPQLD